MEWFIVIKIVQNILNDQNQIRQRHKEQRERECDQTVDWQLLCHRHTDLLNHSVKWSISVIRNFKWSNLISRNCIFKLLQSDILMDQIEENLKSIETP